MSETHELVVVKPKPAPEEIIRLTAEYFNAIGKSYDSFELVTPKRDLFTERVDALLAQYFKENRDKKNILTIACGTGRRELDIEQLSERKLSFTGIEISSEMASLARSRGIEMIEGSFPEVTLPSRDFDTALVLSAFGHVPSKDMRINFLKKVAEALSSGASLFFDVLNLHDQNEWGPRIEATFEKEDLGSFGYDRGDVMYRKIGDREISYYHYFTIDEITSLLDESGFKLKKCLHIGYGNRFGEVVDDENGALFIEASKK